MATLNRLLKSPYLALTLVPLIWSSNFIIGKVLAGNISPFALTTGRFSVAFLALLPIYFYNRGKAGQPVKFSLKSWSLLFLLGLTGVFAFNSLLYQGLKFTSPVNATLINAFNPVLTVLLAVLILKDQLLAGQAVGLICSLAGVVWIAVQGEWANLVNLTFNRGDLIILLATFCWAVYSVSIKKAVTELTPMVITVWSIFTGLLMLYPATFLELTKQPLEPLGWQSILAILYLGIFPSVIAFWLWNRGIAQVGPAKAAMFYNLIPLFAALMSYLFLAEVPSTYHLAGGTLILLGVFWGTKAPAGKQEPGETDPQAGLKQRTGRMEVR